MRPLYGAKQPSLTWRGGFYVPHPEPGSWVLRLEVQSHERTNVVRLNGQIIGYLPIQDFADMWVSVAFPVPDGLLRSGYNELTLEAGPFIPDYQAVDNAWDELLLRRIRLERD